MKYCFRCPYCDTVITTPELDLPLPKACKCSECGGRVRMLMNEAGEFSVQAVDPPDILGTGV